MAVWIVTTGNSDVQLNDEQNWSDLYDRVRYDVPLQNCNKFIDLGDADERTDLYSAPARVLGLVYSHQKSYERDLSFPLLKVFCEFFKNQQDKLEFPRRILVILTDQSQIFSEDEKFYKDCPFWQDTVTLEPLFYEYFKEQFNIEPEFLIIQPNSAQNKGIDRWDEMLTRVEETLEEGLSQLNLQPDELVYVSHQAGTPAISSAIQFLSVSKFNNVCFLNSNQFYNYEEQAWQYEPEPISSSRYWRGLQIQKAQKLLTDGFPGAAVELLRGLVETEKLKEVEKWRDRFNIKPTVKDRALEEFQPQNAGQRVRDALDLIEIFFKQENYLQGITLLAAAQETFMKAALVGKFKTDTKINNLPILEVLQWNNQGLLFLDDRQIRIDDKNLTKEQKREKIKKEEERIKSLIKTKIGLPKNSNNEEFKRAKLNLLRQVKFPLDSPDSNLNLQLKFDSRKLRNLKCTNSNNALLKWLKNLEPQFQSWALLDWIGEYEREFEDDRRNQLMHNLRGVEKKEVLAYLYGKPDETDKMDESLSVREVYRTEIKQPFVKALFDFGLCGGSNDGNDVEEKLQALARSLQ